MKKTIFFVIILIILGALLWMFSNRIEDKKVITKAEDYKNISYTIDGKEIKLVDGVSEEAIPNSSSKITTRYFGNEVMGDFNNDGFEDVTFVLSQDGGGSGIFFYVVAALGQEGGYYKGTDAVLLGDRVSPQTTEFRDGKIIVNYADRKPDEAMATTPSVGISKYLKIEGNNLVEIK